MSHLHLLIPATSSNAGLCRLLFSAAILNYPVPTLINWGTAEDANEFVQHIAKVNKILDYLKGFPKKNDADLVLIVDGYDVWFQLGADVLIRRYFAINKAANKRIASTLGRNVAAEHNYKQSVIFGPDKMCWPSGDGGGRPACWAVPQSPLPQDAFGPINDTDILIALEDPVHARPRWLNSGTVLGTLGDVRAVYEATSNFVNHNHSTDSDQFYFANLFGDQEYSRRQWQQTPTSPAPAAAETPDIAPGQNVEFHMGIDYESRIFQTVGYYEEFISWLRFDAENGRGTKIINPVKTPHGFELPEDIRVSIPPFSAKKRSHWVINSADGRDKMKAPAELSVERGWKDMPLATNLVTKQVFAIIHFTFQKGLRDQWWNRMWYYPRAKELLLASAKATKKRPVPTPVDGRVWLNAESPHLALPDETNKTGQGVKGGAWSDQGKWEPWEALCKPFEKSVFPD